VCREAAWAELTVKVTFVAGSRWEVHGKKKRTGLALRSLRRNPGSCGSSFLFDRNFLSDKKALRAGSHCGTEKFCGKWDLTQAENPALQVSLLSESKKGRSEKKNSLRKRNCGQRKEN